MKQLYDSHTPFTLGTTKTLDFLQTIQLFGHRVMSRKFNSPFHSLGVGEGHKIGLIGCNLHLNESGGAKDYPWQPV